MSALAQLLRSAGASIEAADDLEAINELYCERGWSDGLPIVPPTADRVQAMLAYCDRPWDEAVATIPPRHGAATPLRLAANAVMAGCRPEYFPLVVLAVEALCEEKFNLYGVQATTHPCAPLIIVNGPVAKELGVNSGHNAFGSGTRSNAAIGRAVRLSLLNIGGAIPGLGDMSTFGSPAKYSYCIAENEAASPWEPLHVERGFPADASTVTVIGAECPHNVNDHESISAEGILTTIAGTMSTTGCNDVLCLDQAEPLVVLGPEHAATVAGGGYSKADAKRFLFEHAQLPLSKFAERNVERILRKRYPDRFADTGVDSLVPLAQSADKLIVIVLGGAGKHSAFIPTFGLTSSVTRALKLRDGRLAQSVKEFRRA